MCNECANKPETQDTDRHTTPNATDGRADSRPDRRPDGQTDRQIPLLRKTHPNDRQTNTGRQARKHERIKCA